MRIAIRLSVLFGLLVALGWSALALADVGAHSNFYDQHPRANQQKPDVSVILNRRRHTATVSVRNYCLGAQRDGAQRFPRQADVNVRVRRGKLSFDGKATLLSKQGDTRVRARLNAWVKAKSIAGQVVFPQTKCGTIHFVARLLEHVP